MSIIEGKLGLRQRSVLSRQPDSLQELGYENVPPDKVEVPLTLWERFIAWQPDPDNRFWKFIEDTTWPGWREAVKPDLHVGKRIYWVCYTLICYMYCGFLLKWAWDMNNGHPLSMILEAVEIFVGDLPWPTIDIAMLNSYKLAALEDANLLWEKSRRDKAYPSQRTNTTWFEDESLGLIYCINEICTSQSPLSQVYEFDSSSVFSYIQNFVEYYPNATLKDNPGEIFYKDKIVPQLLDGMVNCSALIMYCAWNGKMDECKKQFRFTYSDFGGICTFNGMPQEAMRREITVSTLFEKEMDSEALTRWIKYNIDNDILMKDGFNATGQLKSVFDEIPLRQRVAGQPLGLSMVLGYKEDEFTCPQHEGFGYRLGVHSPSEESNVRSFGSAIKPNHENFVAIYPEVTLSDKAIMEIPAKRRMCYAADEHELKYFRKYSRGNCITECLSEAIQKECECALISSPKHPGQVLCNPKQKECARNVEQLFYSAGPNRKCPNCLPSCTEIIYKVQVTSIPFSQKNPPKVLNGIDWENTTTAVVHIFYGTMMITAKKRVVKYSVWEYVGLVGGIIGLVLSYAIIDVGHTGLAVISFFTDKPKPLDESLGKRRPLSRVSLQRILKRRRLHDEEDPEVNEENCRPFIIATDPITPPPTSTISSIIEKPKTRRGRVYPKPKSPPPPPPLKQDHLAIEIEMSSPVSSSLHYLGDLYREIREYQNL